MCRSITGHDCGTSNHMTNEWTYSSRLWDAAAGFHDTADALTHLSFSSTSTATAGARHLSGLDPPRCDCHPSVRGHHLGLSAHQHASGERIVTSPPPSRPHISKENKPSCDRLKKKDHSGDIYLHPRYENKGCRHKLVVCGEGKDGEIMPDSCVSVD